MVGPDVDLLVNGFGVEGDFDSGDIAGEMDWECLRRKSGVGRHLENEVPSGEIGEGEISFGIGPGLTDEGAVRALELNCCAGDSGTRGVEDGATYGEGSLGEAPLGSSHCQENNDASKRPTHERILAFEY